MKYRELGRTNQTLANFAMRWILLFEAVTCAILGGKRSAQVKENCRAADLPPISGATMQQDSDNMLFIREKVHRYWYYRTS
ncbi:MAG: hypothetical protein A2030_02415 [Chloroflexi bacterium RBG_19FT_COMBO_50_10]|nr:MAG: hypothetical protein A2Y53_08750 [Chloroflexi bacterium RBG_16_47_49]OGO63545.1 MAG: hypothetical protein A2030_02415 [Chloroflexi bacterium RBG_19FT_COMBO_50_10]